MGAPKHGSRADVSSAASGGSPSADPSLIASTSDTSHPRPGRLADVRRTPLSVTGAIEEIIVHGAQGVPTLTVLLVALSAQ